MIGSKPLVKLPGATLPEDSPIRDEEYVAEGWGDSPQLADELGALIAAKTETTTCSALWEYESEGSSLPEPKIIVLNGNGDLLCIVETTEVEVPTLRRGRRPIRLRRRGGGSFVGVLAAGTLAFFSRTLPSMGKEPATRTCRWCANGSAWCTSSM